MSYGNLISLLVGGVSAGGGGECWGGVLSYLGKKCEMDRLTNGKKKERQQWSGGCSVGLWEEGGSGGADHRWD